MHRQSRTKVVLSSSPEHLLKDQVIVSLEDEAKMLRSKLRASEALSEELDDSLRATSDQVKRLKETEQVFKNQRVQSNSSDGDAETSSIPTPLLRNVILKT